MNRIIAVYLPIVSTTLKRVFHNAPQNNRVHTCQSPRDVPQRSTRHPRNTYQSPASILYRFTMTLVDVVAVDVKVRCFCWFRLSMREECARGARHGVANGPSCLRGAQNAPTGKNRFFVYPRKPTASGPSRISEEAELTAQVGRLTRGVGVQLRREGACALGRRTRCDGSAARCLGDHWCWQTPPYKGQAPPVGCKTPHARSASTVLRCSRGREAARPRVCCKHGTADALDSCAQFTSSHVRWCRAFNDLPGCEAIRSDITSSCRIISFQNISYVTQNTPD